MPKTVPNLPGLEPGPYRSPRSWRRTASSSSPARSARRRAATAPCPGGIEAETRAMLDNVGRLLRTVGLDYADVVRCTVYLLDFTEFAAMNAVYRDVLPDGAAGQGDGGRGRPGHGLPGRDRGHRASRASRSPRSRRSRRTGGPRVPATAMTRLCLPAVFQALLNRASCGRERARREVDGRDVRRRRSRSRLAARRADRAVPDDPAAGEREPGRRAGRRGVPRRVAACSRDGRPASTCPCTRSLALFSETRWSGRPAGARVAFGVVGLRRGWPSGRAPSCPAPARSSSSPGSRSGSRTVTSRSSALDPVSHQ